MGDWIVEMLAWAALEKWWATYPRAIMLRSTPPDDAIYNFLTAVPLHVFRPIADEHQRRVEALRR